MHCKCTFFPWNVQVFSLKKQNKKAYTRSIIALKTLKKKSIPKPRNKARERGNLVFSQEKARLLRLEYRVYCSEIKAILPSNIGSIT